MHDSRLTMAGPPIYTAMTARRLYANEDPPALSLISDSSQRSSRLNKELDLHGLRLGRDDVVEWKDEEPQLPRNWSVRKKAYNNVLVCFFEFWMTAISSSGVRIPG